MTSLAGFEALLRGREVITWGLPFYAGWGLTDDRAPPDSPALRRLLSLVEAVTITPMRSAAFLSTGPKTGRLGTYLEQRFEQLAQFYARYLTKVLRHPNGEPRLFASICPVITAHLSVRQEFVPQQDQDYIIISGQAPAGSSLAYTVNKAKELEVFDGKHPDVERFFTSAGAGGLAAEINQFTMLVKLKPRAQRKKGHIEIMNDLRKDFKSVQGVRAALRDFSARGLTSGRQYQVSFNIFGSDLETLDANAKEIMDRLNAEGLTQDLDTDFKRNFPELLIAQNREAMCAISIACAGTSSSMR